MIKNSQRRIAKRRTGALARRERNVEAYGQLLATAQKDKDITKDKLDFIQKKIDLAKADVANLRAKGVHA